MLEETRLFFAIVPDEAVRTAAQNVARDLRMKMQPGGQLTPPELYHITLVFLGKNLPPETEVLMRAVGRRVSGTPFTLKLNTTGSFKNRETVWWLGCREIPEGLSELRQYLHEQVVKAGVTPERQKFVPHLTFNRGSNTPLMHMLFTPIEWSASDFALIRSVSNGIESKYEILDRWPLSDKVLNASRQQSLI